jgi:hypothetical protein
MGKVGQEHPVGKELLNIVENLEILAVGIAPLDSIPIFPTTHSFTMETL